MRDPLRLSDIWRASGTIVATAAAVFFLSSFVCGVNAAVVFSGTSGDVGVLTDVPQGAALADFDNDGLLDVVSTVRSGSDYEVIAWKNNGTPFASGTWTRCNVGALLADGFSVAAADLDKDGDMDIVVGANVAEDYEIIAFENDGSPFDGVWPQHDVGASGTPEFTVVALGDLDNDSWIDIVSVGGGGGGGYIRVWQNDGTPFNGLWSSNAAFSALNIGQALAVADLDNDSYLDIAANVNTSDGWVNVFRNDGTPFVGAWASNVMGYTCSGWPGDIDAADLDNDGYVDLVTSCGYLPYYNQRIWKNDGTPFSGTWSMNGLGNVSGTRAATGDFDLDGRVDIAMVCNNGDVLAWENDGTPFSGSWTRRDIGKATSSGMAVVTGDLDGDGDIDIVTGSGTGVGEARKVSAWENLAVATVSVLPSQTLTNCTTSASVEFHIEHQPSVLAEVRGYEVIFEIDPAVATVVNPGGDIVEGDFLSSAGLTQFYVTDNGGGVYTVTCAILGGDGGGGGGGALFSVLLTPVAEGTSAITITSIKLRDINNNPLPVYGGSGSIRVDCTPPTMEDIAEPQGVWYNAAPVLSNFGFDDDVNLDLADYNYDGGSWTAIFSGIDAAAWDSDGWALPDFDGLSQGTHTVYFRVKDDAGNWNTATYSWQFYKDTVAPQPPTNFVAMPGHDKTHLTWTNPSGDATFVGVEIRFNGWVDYPEYATSAPAYPPDHTAGTLVTLAAGTSFDDNPRTPRDIYYYSAFSKDLAGNYSVLGTTAFDRCTSYWLGDVIPSPGFDGLVNISDLAAFSGTFAVIEGGGGWNAHCDFGPTDDHSRFGIPLPDNKVNFEDLMIFSMNYSKVTPAGLQEGVAAARVVENLKDLVAFTLVSNADGSISIVLANKASTLKGIHFVATVEGGTLERVDRGSFFTGRGDLFFGLVPSTSNTADISTAALGVDKALAGSGEVARLVIASDGASAPRVRIDAIDLRDLTNAKTELVAAEEYEAPFVPTATALMQNFPNPFNPVTTIAFDLTAAGRVRIDIYDVSGRLLATPVDAAKVAGRHQVEWNGKDASGSLVPSGIYFYRMKTAGYEATRKMILVR